VTTKSQEEQHRNRTECAGVAQRERESLTTDSDLDAHSDPHSLLFGGDDDSRDNTGEFEAVPLTRADRRRDRRQHDHLKRRRRRGRLFMLFTLLIVAAVAVLVVPRVVDYFRVADYSGAGTGSVDITIPSGATASDIGDILKKADVVKSTEAFTNAASDNSKSESIQPGTYTLHQHMSGVAALNLLLDPSSRDTNHDALVTEGETTIDVAKTVNKICGPGQDAATATALSSAADLGIPVSYKVGSKPPSSAEGFLYPATYNLDPNCKPAAVLQNMVSRFIQQDRSMHFAATAPHINQTPYSALIIASIAQSEAKYPQDMPKVVATILNHLNASIPLKFDSTSSYACKLKQETHCIYNQIDSPYNTYTHKGLPPTPIDNPGAEALRAAVHPAIGNWLFFVNKDKAGHLTFTHSEKAFEKARLKCVKNNWGCG
jgi:UPF0755 protein